MFLNSIKMQAFAGTQDTKAVLLPENVLCLFSATDCQVNGKNFMEMFSLDVSQPLWVHPECSEEEYHLLKWDVGKFTLD